VPLSRTGEQLPFAMRERFGVARFNGLAAPRMAD
jgi:hypothetical protein